MFSGCLLYLHSSNRSNRKECKFGESYLLTIGPYIEEEAKQDVLSKLDSEPYLIILDLVMTFFHSVVRANE